MAPSASRVGIPPMAACFDAALARLSQLRAALGSPAASLSRCPSMALASGCFSPRRFTWNESPTLQRGWAATCASSRWWLSEGGGACTSAAKCLCALIQVPRERPGGFECGLALAFETALTGRVGSPSPVQSRVLGKCAYNRGVADLVPQPPASLYVACRRGNRRR